MSVGDHWQWQVRGQDESLQDGDARELGSEVAPTTRRRARRIGPTLELMVPPRSDLPIKGVVAGRGGGGSAHSRARRAGGGDVVEGLGRGVFGEYSAIVGSGATECAPVGGAQAAQVVSSGAEERARLLSELAELGAGVRAQRASRLEHLRAVAADLTSCSGVTWRGL